MDEWDYKYKQDCDFYMIHPTYSDVNNVIWRTPGAYREEENLQ